MTSPGAAVTPSSIVSVSVPFAPEHLDAAAALLAARHRTQRVTAPLLDAH